MNSGTQIPPSILVADPSPVSRDLLARILRGGGFRVLPAGDGQTALQRCAGEPVDLVLLDALLSAKSGFQVCSELKCNPATSDIPVIFVSAVDDPRNRIAGFDAGCVDYIAKPFDGREVLARVRVHLRLKEAAECLVQRQKNHFEELRAAQQSLLVTPESVPEARFAVYYRPLDEVGGDIYDVVPLSTDSVGFFVADISGHGVQASFLTVAVKTLLRQYSGPLFAIEETMRNMNSVMRTILHEGYYLTACYAQLSRSRRVLSLVNAGHPPPVVVSRDGASKLIGAEGDPLGVFGSVVFQKQELELREGDRFYFYTDGLIEDHRLPGGGRSIGLERLTDSCRLRRGVPLEEGVRAIVADVKPDLSSLDDDLLLLAAEVMS